MSDLPPAMTMYNQKRAFAKICASILKERCPPPLYFQQFTTVVEGKRIYEATHRTDLVEAIFNEDFPRFLEPVELDHYTKLASLRGIAQSGQLHLSSLTKWLDNGEYTTFANEHDLKGYIEPAHREAILLRCGKIANKSRGVRIRFCVNPLRADLRKVGYSQGQQTVFGKINSLLKSETALVFTPWGISRICAFYLGSGYQHESEVRLLIKRHAGGPDRSLDSHFGRIWPLEVVEERAGSEDLLCNLELLSVTRAPNATKDAIQGILNGTRFASIPIYDPQS